MPFIINATSFLLCVALMMYYKRTEKTSDFVKTCFIASFIFIVGIIVKNVLN